MLPDLRMGSPDMSNGFPAPPSLGAQIDRLGRPGVNTALTDPFWDDGVQTAAMHHSKQDSYNQASTPASWATTTIGSSTVLALFKAYAAAYDGLDNNCGNQVAFAGPLGAAYTTLATVLSDDEMWVDSSQTTCAQYLAVELKTLGTANTDCGGRALTYNVIDTTYNALAGTAPGTVKNGVTSDGDGSPTDTTFPYLGNPN